MLLGITWLYYNIITFKIMGPYKRAYIAMPQRLLRCRHKAKAAAMHEKECSSSRAYTTLWIAAPGLRQPQWCNAQSAAAAAHRGG